jgi:ABC-type multidrug transport system fused ATPase/permease subunit
VDGQTGGQPAPWVLENLDFSLSQGGKIAVVGPSGAGKSTLAYLLLRFWEYTQGRILLGGKELHCYRQEDVRRMLSLVSQTTDLFNATIKDNLLLARPDAAQEDLFRAARLAQMHDFILSLPQGYDTWIGEQGLRMSGGERQRLAVARALLKDAPLLILDEPTANLDPSTERRLLDCLKVMMQDRTTLLITHRLVGLETMDEILVLDKGRVVERGCHADLLEAGGLYRRLWELQNQAVADAWDV